MSRLTMNDKIKAIHEYMEKNYHTTSSLKENWWERKKIYKNYQSNKDNGNAQSMFSRND